jgi:hypothetical protein
MRDRNELQFQFWGVRITARGEKAIRGGAMADDRSAWRRRACCSRRSLRRAAKPARNYGDRNYGDSAELQ